MRPDAAQHLDLTYEIQVLGRVESTLEHLAQAPRQPDEGAPDAWLVFPQPTSPALEGLSTGEDILVLTWLHLAERNVLRVHPRGDRGNPMRGVFATRSPGRPNPIGIHRTTVLEIEGARLRVAALEAVNGTPIIDIKPVLSDDER